MCYFLYCAMFEENAKIPVENLVWITEGLVKTIEDVEYDYLLEIGNNYVKLLENCCLLHVNEDWITVHDVLYDMEIPIGEKDNCVFRAGQSLIHFPHIEVPHDCKRISVRHNSIRSESLPELVSLALGENRDMGKIQHGFLLNFTSLKVLELSGIDALKSLPPSLWQLTQLQYPCW